MPSARNFFLRKIANKNLKIGEISDIIFIESERKPLLNNHFLKSRKDKEKSQWKTLS
jgi:hypothetical protein